MYNGCVFVTQFPVVLYALKEKNGYTHTKFETTTLRLLISFATNVILFAVYQERY